MRHSGSILIFWWMILGVTVGIGAICQDDIYRNCKQRARQGFCQGWGGGDLFLEARKMLSECRKSCQEVLQNLTDVPEMIKLYGGTDEEITDQFGFRNNLCGNDVTTAARFEILFVFAKANVQPKWVPRFTQIGFIKTNIPAQIYSSILEEYRHSLDNMKITVEKCEIGVINCQSIVIEEDECKTFYNGRNSVIAMRDILKEQVQEELQPLVEEWVGIKLEPSFVYGIRRYTNQSTLTSHIDSLHTNVVGIILNIEQDVAEEWPLYIKDNSGNSHALHLLPGEMVMYESARLIHGRPKPLNGIYYDNLFIHFTPSSAWYKENLQLGRNPREVPITLQEILNKQQQSSLFD